MSFKSRLERVEARPTVAEHSLEFWRVDGDTVTNTGSGETLTVAAYERRQAENPATLFFTISRRPGNG